MSSEVLTRNVYISGLGPLFAWGVRPSWAQYFHPQVSIMQFCSTMLAKEESAPLLTRLEWFRMRQTFRARYSMDISRFLRSTCYNPNLLLGKRGQCDWCRLRTFYAAVGSWYLIADPWRYTAGLTARVENGLKWSLKSLCWKMEELI